MAQGSVGTVSTLRPTFSLDGAENGPGGVDSGTREEALRPKLGRWRAACHFAAAPVALAPHAYVESGMAHGSRRLGGQSNSVRGGGRQEPTAIYSHSGTQ
jgi:hypothetical protein